MKKPPIYLFFDDVLREYKKFYEENWEEKLLIDLKWYLAEFFENSEINLITLQETSKIIKWLSKNDLYKFIQNVSNPLIR